MVQGQAARAACASDADCKSNRACIKGSCSAAECTKDTDCAGEQVCDDMRCRAPAPVSSPGNEVRSGEAVQPAVPPDAVPSIRPSVPATYWRVPDGAFDVQELVRERKCVGQLSTYLTLGVNRRVGILVVGADPANPALLVVAAELRNKLKEKLDAFRNVPAFNLGVLRQTPAVAVLAQSLAKHRLGGAIILSVWPTEVHGALGHKVSVTNGMGVRCGEPYVGGNLVPFTPPTDYGARVVAAAQQYFASNALRADNGSLERGDGTPVAAGWLASQVSDAELDRAIEDLAEGAEKRSRAGKVRCISCGICTVVPLIGLGGLLWASQMESGAKRTFTPGDLRSAVAKYNGQLMGSLRLSKEQVPAGFVVP